MDEKKDGLRRRSRDPWAKFDRVSGIYHHLAHHCADVAACLEAIVGLPTIRSRLDQAAGESLSPEIVERLAVLCFLHDAGKLHPGFQAKGWPETIWSGRRHGHLHEGAAIFGSNVLPEIADRLCLEDLSRWGVDIGLLYAVLAHHGRPIAPNSDGEKEWTAVSTSAGVYDPLTAAAEIGSALRRWFPLAFSSEPRPLPSTASFQHLFAGLVTLSDWIGSDQRFFPFVAELDLDYIHHARKSAKEAVSTIGLDVSAIRPCGEEPKGFLSITGFAAPTDSQKIVNTISAEEQLVILEAETGSGKTEAAFMRFARLFEAGKVDGLYFALPTRSSAVQMHGRVDQMLKRFLGARAPEAVLAVPGYLIAGQSEGQALPDWKVTWEDEGEVNDEVLEARWAAESTKRYLAAMVAVGTVDQAMLAALQVKHAHLRAAALSRSLLVIDEVHASDSYMTEVQGNLLDLHLQRGGYAILMSATLGSRARAKWLGSRTPSYEEAMEVPYPAVWRRSRKEPISALPQGQKRVAMTLVPTMEPEESARIAIEAAKRGARVLVIRNTVKSATATWSRVRQAGGENLLMNAGNGPALHHGRFAPEDRRLLDRSVEEALSPKSRNDAGVIVIGTQTLEQSLDIDTDFLITDLCPIDVLLQRLGRLHRHQFCGRPNGFTTPACSVMTPARGLSALLPPDFENGLGAWKIQGVVSGIYRDLSMLELTRRLILKHPVWSLPAMNRMLVESATHEEAIDALHAELGRQWSEYRNDVIGAEIANRGAARNVALRTDLPFCDPNVLFARDEERIRTRLGEEGARVTFEKPVIGPFGREISGLTLPAHWSRGLDTRIPVETEHINGLLAVRVAGRMFHYDRSGVTKGNS